MTDAWSSDLYHLGGTAGYIGCRAHNSGSQSLTDSATTAITLGAESIDSDPNGAMHDNSTNPSRITIRTAGVYHLSCWVQYASNSTGYRATGLRLNGSTALAQDVRGAVNGTTTEATVATSYVLAASDYIEITGLQTSTGALNVTNAALAVVKA